MTDTAAHLIEAAELQSQLGRDDVVIVDCRFNLLEPDAGRRAWREGHIPGAVYAHLDDDLAVPAQPAQGRHPLPSPDDFARTLGQLGIDRDMRVVAYDDAGGAIAARLWWMLGWIGHRRRSLLNGGMTAWQAAEFPLEAGEVVRASCEYGAIEVDDAQVVTTDDIAADHAGSAHGSMLLDARAGPRYRGETEPIDPVAGHVPGALNLPFSDLLGPDSRFLPPDELEDVFGRIIDADPKTAAITTMCGSGVTACHLLAGLAVIGGAGRLYVGSWSEWIRDADRPVATATGS